ncbi:hypothetical protein ABZ746_26200 [Streptomyces sp. NPDC020096]
MTTPSTRTDVVIRTYGPGLVPPLMDALADIWADAHPELVNNPGGATAGLSVPALHRQITGHLKHQGFALAVAYAGGTAVGFGYAFPCSATYWFGSELVDQVPEAEPRFVAVMLGRWARQRPVPKERGREGRGRMSLERAGRSSLAHSPSNPGV